MHGDPWCGCLGVPLSGVLLVIDAVFSPTGRNSLTAHRGFSSDDSEFILFLFLEQCGNRRLFGTDLILSG